MADDMEVEVLAYQWGWEFTYPNNVTTQDRLVIPVDTDVRFSLTSTDVIHSIYIPDFGLKQDIFPQQESIARTNATQTGNYTIYCAELCGSGHSRMHGTVTVMNQSAYDDWMAERQGNVTAANTSSTSAGTNATATPAA
jgi:cytochrome c oxidase subunit 2